MNEKTDYQQKYNALSEHLRSLDIQYRKNSFDSDKYHYFTLLKQVKQTNEPIYNTLNQLGYVTADELLFVNLRTSVREFSNISPNSALERNVEGMITYQLTDQLDEEDITITALNESIANMIFKFYDENYIKKPTIGKNKEFLQDMLLEYLIVTGGQTTDINGVKKYFKEVIKTLLITTDDFIVARMNDDKSKIDLYEAMIKLNTLTSKKFNFTNYIRGVYTLYKKTNVSGEIKTSLVNMMEKMIGILSPNKLQNGNKNETGNTPNTIIKQTHDIADKIKTGNLARIAKLRQKATHKKAAGIALFVLAVLGIAAAFTTIFLFPFLATVAATVAVKIALSFAPLLAFALIAGGFNCAVYAEKFFTQAQTLNHHAQPLEEDDVESNPITSQMLQITRNPDPEKQLNSEQNRPQQATPPALRRKQEEQEERDPFSYPTLYHTCPNK